MKIILYRINKDNDIVLSREMFNYLMECKKLRDNAYGKYVTRKLKVDRIENTINYYLKTLGKNGIMPDEAVKMFNILEGNI